MSVHPINLRSSLPKAPRWQSVGFQFYNNLFRCTYCLLSSFFQALCVLGYCVAPLDVAALVSFFVPIVWVRAPVALIAWAWCIWGRCFCMIIFSAMISHFVLASINFFDGTKIEQQRILLAVYPLLWVSSHDFNHFDTFAHWAFSLVSSILSLLGWY